MIGDIFVLSMMAARGCEQAIAELKKLFGPEEFTTFANGYIMPEDSNDRLNVLTNSPFDPRLAAIVQNDTQPYIPTSSIEEEEEEKDFVFLEMGDVPNTDNQSSNTLTPEQEQRKFLLQFQSMNLGPRISLTPEAQALVNQAQNEQQFIVTGLNSNIQQFLKAKSSNEPQLVINPTDRPVPRQPNYDVTSSSWARYAREQRVGIRRR